MKNFLKNLFSKNAEEKTFEKQIMDAGMGPNIITGIVTVVYMLITVNFPKENTLSLIVSAILIMLILQFIIAPNTNRLITKNVSERLEDFYNWESTEKERTRLLKDVLLIPEKIGLEVFVIFYFGVIAWTFLCCKLIPMNHEMIVSFLSAGFFGSYAGYVFSLEVTQKLCSKKACLIVDKGISKEEISKKHYFGTDSKRLVFFHIFGPILLINIFYMTLSWRIFKSPLIFDGVFTKFIIIFIINNVFYALLSSILFLRMIKKINFTTEILDNMNKENLNDIKHSSTDLSNEFMYNIYLINTITDILQKILKETNAISLEVVESSNELSVISKETAVTSLEQSSAIKELLAAMEESDNMARTISSKIEDVSIVAKNTTTVIYDGFSILNQNIEKLSEIKNANEITMDGIKTLSEKISGISDIAHLINSIADQTNLIAFNAELEASSAGDDGSNFNTVAKEVRRLTNNTIQSTNEIKERLYEIQKSSEKLILSSKNGSQKIEDENKIVKELQKNFENLKESSQSTDSSCDEINLIIQQQTSSFEQIVETLRELSKAIESFSSSTQSISLNAENLCQIADKLNNLNSGKSEEK